MTSGELMLPMLANPVKYEDLDKLFDKYNLIVEPKLDGIRCVVDTGSPVDSVKLYSRTGHDLTGKVPIKLLQQLNKLPFYMLLDGELGILDKTLNAPGPVWPILDFNATQRILGSGELEAQRKLSLESREMKFYVFDIIQEGSLAHRLEDMTRLFYHINPLWLIQRVMPSEVHHRVGFFEEVYQDYVDFGGEGVMLKNIDASYYPNKRKAGTWWKVKKYDTIDVTITGYIEGQGKYAGQIGAIKFVDEDGVEGKCSGMTDAERLHFTSWSVEFLGKTMEIRHFGRLAKGGDGGYRFPQFVRMRTIK